MEGEGGTYTLSPCPARTVRLDTEGVGFPRADRDDQPLAAHEALVRPRVHHAEFAAKRVVRKGCDVRVSVKEKGGTRGK